MENGGGYNPSGGQIKRTVSRPVESTSTIEAQPGADFFRRQKEALDLQRQQVGGARHQSEVHVATSDSKAPDLSREGKKTLLKEMNKRYGGGA